MREFQVSRYIKAWLPLIIAFCVTATAGVYILLSRAQTYEASAVIRYEDGNAEEGLTPLGAQLDVNEIKSSGIMSKVLANLNQMEISRSLDEYTSRISIIPVVDEDEEARKTALLEGGEEYTAKPTTYIVSFKAEHDEGAKFALELLNEILDVYFAEYSRNHMNIGSVSNPVGEILDESYDYIEIMEIIEANISNTLSTLDGYAQTAPHFRAVSTGMSYSDLAGEFRLLEAVNVSNLYSKILANRISKDRDLLISRYEERIKSYRIYNEAEERQISDVMALIDSYVQKMRESGNTNITSDYILGSVYEGNLYGTEGDMIVEGDQTVTYDQLLYSLRDHSESQSHTSIDIAYCESIIQQFSRGARGSRYDQIVSEVDQELQKLTEQLDQLYAEAEATTIEYSNYVGSQSISMLSTTAVKKSVNVEMYTVIAAIFFLIICCCCAILLGRLNDIIQYLFYMDHMTGLHNRSAFDSYLNSRRKKILGGGVACVLVSILNQVEINERFGREEGNRLLELFARNLKEIFGEMEVFLVYNGNSRFIGVLEKTDAATIEYAIECFVRLTERREILQEAGIEYEIGWSETEKDQIDHLPDLLTKASSSRVHYWSGDGRTKKGE